MKLLKVNLRTVFAFGHDIIAGVVAWSMAFLLRFNFDMPPSFVHTMWKTLLWLIPLQTGVFIYFGLYRGIWRFASLPDLARILKALLSSAALLAAVLFMFKPYGVIPRSVLLLNPILLILLMGGSRLAYRAWKEHKLYGFTQVQGEPVLILGAGDAGLALVKDLSRSTQWRVVGLLDDDNRLLGRDLFGVKVLGGIDQLKVVAQKQDVSHAILAMPSATHETRKKVIDLANHIDLEVLTVPAIDDLMSGKISISAVRKVEVEDLLGREPVQLDNAGLEGLIEGKVTMVTGAGGSIGSELCRQILKYHPQKLICFDISEYALYSLEQELIKQVNNISLVYLTGDVRNQHRVKQVLSDYQPNLVFHAAAYKHVPLMENHNVLEAMQNNVQGTYTVAKACKDAQVNKFVLISTDKAVNPTNVMGASKRLAEMVCQSLQDGCEKTSFVIVRFGNVLGSSGSVIPKFREQIAKGGPVTVTHPEITRFFMSIPEAAQLVMQAGLMGKGGEIFVLDMGVPVRIVDLAQDMIRLSGFRIEDIKIEFTGLRPGEKLYEELLADDETTVKTYHPKLRVANARQVNSQWVESLLLWLNKANNSNELKIKQDLKSWIEEYSIYDSTPQSVDLSIDRPTVH